jgi:hypothetical protein
MRIMVFTEGTLLTHETWVGLPREEIVRLVRAGRAPSDFSGSVPVDRAVEKLWAWQRQGAQISYLTSRTRPDQVETIRQVLQRYGFPQGELFFRQGNEAYADVAERVMPDILIEDDCESIGGEIEMTYPRIRPELQARIKSIIVREFGGIDHLPDHLVALARRTAAYERTRSDSQNDSTNDR